MKQTYNNPTWWTPANDTAWDRTKAAFKRDWDQTKHDLGANRPDNPPVSNWAGQRPAIPFQTVIGSREKIMLVAQE